MGRSNLHIQTILYDPIFTTFHHNLFPLPSKSHLALVQEFSPDPVNGIVQFLNGWMRLVAFLLTTPTSTIFRAVSGLWCVLPLLSPPLHHSCLSFPVDGSIFDSAEFQQVHLYPLRLATQASFALPSCSHWPLPHPSLLEALDRRYLGFEGVCSFGSCTH